MTTDKIYPEYTRLKEENARLQSELDRVVAAGAKHADRVDEIYAENARLRESISDIIGSSSEETVWVDNGYSTYGGTATTVDSDALDEAENLLTELEKGDE